MTRIAILGASAAGCAVASFLRDKGHEIDLYESRPDLRQVEGEVYRSVSITLSDRGLRVLDALGLGELARGIAVPVRGRAIHAADGRLFTQPYGGDGQVLHCLSRIELTKILLDEAERAGARLHFELRCDRIDPGAPSLSLTDRSTGESCTVRSDLLLGADGPFSVARRSLETTEGFAVESPEFPVTYREAVLPPDATGRWRLDPARLHVWPRGDTFVIGFPMTDGSFVCMLFHPCADGQSSSPFADDRGTREYIDREFAELSALAPDLADRFFVLPAGRLPRSRCQPWIHGGRFALVGDSAHTILPFCGQGMNATFEDCEALCESLQDHEGDVARALFTYQERRKPNADAIDRLSEDHFFYLTRFSSTPESIRFKSIETALQREHEDFVPLYSLIEFTSIPYSLVEQVGELQRELIEQLAAIEASGSSWRSAEGRARVAATLEKVRSLTSSRERS